MTTQRIALILTLVNLVVLLVMLGQAERTEAQSVQPVLRARVLELVDEQGRVRSRLNTEAEGTAVFRLMDQNGTIRVKLGADEDGSALLLLDEATEPGVHLVARRAASAAKPNTTGVVLRGAGGRQRAITP